MTYAEMFGTVRRQYPDVDIEAVQFETNRSGLDVDDLNWDINDAGIDGVEIMAWPYGHSGANDAGREMVFRQMFPLE